MKELRRYIFTHFTCFAVLLIVFSHTNPCYAENDSIRISLLTCDPHNEVYSLYGHSALRFEDQTKGIDVAINYGMFSFDKPFFVLRFVFGLTDYEMGIVPFDLFCREYEYYGSRVQQQEITLTAKEKQQIISAIYENFKPENRVYRYNYFYDNCTTRARDMITDHLDGKIEYHTAVPEGLTFRKMIHEMNTDFPWARLGNDLLLGVKADQQLDEKEMQFLPLSMLTAANDATVTTGDGKKYKFVKSCSTIVEGKEMKVDDGFPLSPIAVGWIILGITIIICIIEKRKTIYFWGYDALLLLVQGICGIIITAMIFSQHPTVSLNIQILLFNPLPLFLGYVAIKSYIKKRIIHEFWLVNILTICLMLVLSSMSVQWIDPSVKLLALSLLARCCMKLYDVWKLK